MCHEVLAGSPTVSYRDWSGADVHVALAWAGLDRSPPLIWTRISRSFRRPPCQVHWQDFRPTTRQAPSRCRRTRKWRTIRWWMSGSAGGSAADPFLRAIFARRLNGTNSTTITRNIASTGMCLGRPAPAVAAAAACRARSACSGRDPALLWWSQCELQRPRLLLPGNRLWWIFTRPHHFYNSTRSSTEATAPILEP